MPDRRRMEIDAELQLPGGRFHEVHQRPRGDVAAAGMAEIRHGNLSPFHGVVVAPLAHDRGNLILRLHFPIRGVGEDVDADLPRGVDLRLHRGSERPLPPAAAKLPKARERGSRVAGRIGRGIDHARAAAELDPQQRPQLLRRHLLLRVPNRMRRVQQLQPILRLVGKHHLHQLAEALVELPPAAIALGEEESAVVEIIAQASARTPAARGRCGARG